MQSVVRLMHEPEVPGSIPSPATYFVLLPLIQERQLSVTGLGDLSLSRKSVVRLTDCPDMTLDGYHGCKATTQKQHIAKGTEVEFNIS